MTWTKYYRPQTVNYFAPDGTGWADPSGGLTTVRNLIMVDHLIGNAFSRGGLVSSDCRALLLTNFGIPLQAGTVRGIELETHIERYNRVVDARVQLALAGEAVGLDLATTALDNIQVYGGQDNLWGLATVNYATADFGLILDLKPNELTPSSERPIIRDVKLRLWVE